MASSTSIHLQADGEGLRITAEGNYDVFCAANSSWAHVIRDINIYGLEDEINNYDDMRYLTAAIDLCELQMESEIVYNFVSSE